MHKALKAILEIASRPDGESYNRAKRLALSLPKKSLDCEELKNLLAGSDKVNPPKVWIWNIARLLLLTRFQDKLKYEDIKECTYSFDREISSRAEEILLEKHPEKILDKKDRDFMNEYFDESL